MDYRHPFLVNSRLLVSYAAVWLVTSVILVLITTLVNETPLGLAILEIFTFMFLFALLGSAIWYVIRFSALEKNKIVWVFLSHIIAATILVLLWLYMGVVIIKLIHPNAQMWLKKSLTVRLIGGYGLYIVNVVFFYAVIYYHAFKEKSKNERKLKGLVKEAELHALKSQINPHFLFNSLNSISSLTMTNPEHAQEMVINLSQLMRYSLKHNQSKKVSLKQELENNKLYLSIEKVRFGDKLNPIFAIEKECLAAEIPNMILQPLYENAIKYGVYEATEAVEIITTANCKENLLEVTISNSYDKNVVSKKGEGIGLRNIRDRLQVIYSNPYLLKIEDENDKFTVTLTIPQKI